MTQDSDEYVLPIVFGAFIIIFIYILLNSSSINTNCNCIQQKNVTSQITLSPIPKLQIPKLQINEIPMKDQLEVISSVRNGALKNYRTCLNNTIIVNNSNKYNFCKKFYKEQFGVDSDDNRTYIYKINTTDFDKYTNDVINKKYINYTQCKDNFITSDSTSEVDKNFSDICSEFYQDNAYVLNDTIDKRKPLYKMNDTNISNYVLDVRNKKYINYTQCVDNFVNNGSNQQTRNKFSNICNEFYTDNNYYINDMNDSRKKEYI